MNKNDFINAYSIKTEKTKKESAILVDTFLETLKDTDPVTAKIATRVALNWPHFVRVTRLFQQIIEEKRTEVLENLKKHLSDE